MHISVKNQFKNWEARGLVPCPINHLTFNVILNAMRSIGGVERLQVKNLIFFCILVEILHHFTPQNNIVIQSGRERSRF